MNDLLLFLFLGILLLTIFFGMLSRLSSPSFSESSQMLGRQEMAQSRMIFAGLMRDGETRIPYLKERLEFWGSFFQDYRILIVENDSQDATRERLLEWTRVNPRVILLGCGINAPQCTLSLPPSPSNVTSARISKMAYLRNLYLEHMREYYADWDYLLVHDLDWMGDFSLRGWIDSFYHFSVRKEIAGLTCYGHRDFIFWDKYSDALALRFASDALDFPSEREYKNHNLWVFFHFHPPWEGSLVPVKSAFSGLAIYRISSIPVHARYDVGSTEISCEHSYFHQDLPALYVNPKMKFRLRKNGF